MDGVINMKEYIELNLTPFEQFMESVDVEMDDMDDADLYTEMCYSYENLLDMYQEGEFWDRVTGAGKDEGIIAKIILFIPRLVMAALSALFGRKTKAAVDELEQVQKSQKSQKSLTFCPYDENYHDYLFDIVKEFDKLSVNYSSKLEKMFNEFVNYYERNNITWRNGDSEAEYTKIGNKCLGFTGDRDIKIKDITDTDVQYETSDAIATVLVLYKMATNAVNRINKDRKFYDKISKANFGERQQLAGGKTAGMSAGEAFLSYFQYEFKPRIFGMTKAINQAIMDVDKMLLGHVTPINKTVPGYVEYMI